MKVSRIFIIFLTIFFNSPLCIFAQDGLWIKKVTFRGNEFISDDDLAEQISIHGISSFSKSILRKDPILYDKELVGRARRNLTIYYQRVGFLFVRIQEPFLNINEKNKSVEILFNIIEGDPILVNEVDFDYLGNERSDFELRIKKASQDLSLKNKERFREKDIKSDQNYLRKEFNDIGYPYTEVNYELNVDEISPQVDIRWNIDAGPLSHFSEIKISGNNKVSDNLIWKQLAFEEGETYSQEQIDKTQDRIYSLGLFQLVTVKAILTSERDSLIPIEIQVKEAPRFTTKFGVGYGREDRFRTFINARQLGFLGGARRLDFLIKHSGLEPYNIDLRFTQPVFFSHKTALMLNPYLRREEEPGYAVDRFGGKLSVLHQFNVNLGGSFGFIYERVNQDLGESGLVVNTSGIKETLYNKVGPILGLTINTSEPLFNPSRGMFILLTYKVNGIFLKSDFPYTKVILDGRRYQGISAFVLAYRVKIGSINPQQKNGFIPVEERFYAGGSTSVRGWARQQLGPKDEFGDPIGGNSVFEGSVEARFPLIKMLAGVFFLDFGNVWLTSATYKLNELRYALGVGVGLDTPIGPVRLDVARPIFDEESKTQFHLNIGHAF